ncbi:DNA replication licensing factor MCM3-like [Artemia franciscana]|uniref:DNA replication licensing factor MCM3-like n=1 Tax=Artemia franciscana TaxID=6661 RepID=UPI0032DA8782
MLNGKNSKVLEKPRKRRRDDEESEESEAEVKSDDDTESTQKSNKQRKERTGASDVYDFESDDDVVVPSTPRASRGSRSQRSTTDTQTSIQTDASSQERGITKERFELFRNTIRELMVARNAQTVEMSILRSTLETKTEGGMFTDEEVRVAIDLMTEENQIMVADDIIFLI